MQKRIIRIASSLLARLRAVNLWHLTGIIVLSEIFTAGMNTLMGTIWWGHISYDLIQIGFVDAFVVSLIVGTIVLMVFGVLREARQKYGSLIANAGDAIFLIDGSGRFLEVNRKTEDLTGFSADELLARSFFDIILCEQKPGSGSFDWMFERNTSYSGTFFIAQKSGDMVIAELTGSVIMHGGHPVAQMIARDVTGRIQAEKALHASEQKFRSIVETSSEWIWAIDTAGRHTYCNPAVTAILGYPPEELLGRNAREFLYADDRQKVAELIAECLRAERGWANLVLRWTHRDGSIRWLESTAVPILNENGELEGFRGTDRDITERVLAEAAIRESEQRYRDVVENANSIILRMDSAGYVLFFNKFAERFFGYPAAEIVGRSVVGTIVPKTESTGRDLSRMIADICTHPDRYTSNVNENMRRDGERVWISWTNRPVYGSDGELREVLCIGQDISELKRANEQLLEYRLHLEELVMARTAELSDAVSRLKAENIERHLAELALRTSQEKFRKAFRSSPDWITISTLNDGRYIEVNDAFERISGYSREEAIGRTSVDLGIWVDPAERTEMLKTLLLKGMLRNQEVQFRTRTGSVLTMVRSSELITVDGETCIISVTHDITTRKRTEEALIESEERFREIFEQNEDALLVLDPTTCGIIDANPAAVSLYGYSRAELIRWGMACIVETEHLGSFADAVKGVSAPGGLRISQMPNVRKDRSHLVVSVRGKMIRLRKSDVLFCSLRDISERLRFEQEARFMQAKLIQANKMTSLGLLVSSIAHEVNNPNNFILSNAQMVADAWQDIALMLDAYYREHGDFSVGGVPFSEMRDLMPRLLDAISEGSGRIRDIIRTLKDFARPDRSSLQSEVDMNTIISTSVMLLGSQIKKYTDHFAVETGEHLPPVNGNRQQLEQVIVNLIMNALQSLQDRHQGVVVSSNFEPNTGSVVVRVTDSGQGMSAETLSHIAEPFFTTRLGEGGTGLGLFIAHSIIKDHAGSMTFESKPGFGTVASLAFPACSVAAERT